MVVEHTIDAFESNPHIDEIAIVSNPFILLTLSPSLSRMDGKK